MYGNSIALAALPELGEYEFEFEIADTNSETSIAKSVTLKITE
jgi:hypothetical protein